MTAIFATMSPIVITIDGPAGAGKSTTARLVAQELKYTYIDTGAMYRAVTLAAIRNNTTFSDDSLGKLCQGLLIDIAQSPDGQRTYLNGNDVTADLRNPEVTNKVSEVSSFHSVRTHLVQRQREMGLKGGIVMDGRDIGSVVFPHAQVKVFLVADLDVRAHRRFLEQTEGKVSVEELSEQLKERDRFDSERKESPLVKPDGAVELDTTNLSINEQVQSILKLVRNYQRADGLVSKYLNL